MALPSLSFPSIGEIVEDRLEFLILAGVFRPDDIMPSERKLAEQFDVSRTAVRAALSRLRAKQLIKKTPSSHQVSISFADDLVKRLSTVGNQNPREILRAWWFLLHELHAFVAHRPTLVDNQRIAEALALSIDTLQSNKTKKRFNAIKELSIRLSEASYNFCYMQAMSACLSAAEAPLSALLENLGTNEKELWVDQLRLLDPAQGLKNRTNPYFFDELGPVAAVAAGQATVESQNTSSEARVVEALQKHIKDCAVAIGDELASVRDLAIKLGVSEDSVKLAIVELRALEMIATDGNGIDRLVSHRPKSATVALVESILAQPYAIESVFDFRIPIECDIVASAARRANAEQLVELEAVITRMGEICAVDPSEFANLDSRFHMLLAQAADKEGLSALYDGFLPILSKVTQHWLKKHSNRLGDNMRIHMQHVEIWNAVLTKNPTAASTAMRSHLEYVLISLQEFERRSYFEQISALRQNG